jgi:hypothetical protein
MKKYLVGLPLVAFAGSVFADVPADVTTALTTAKTDALSVAALGLIIVISIAAFKFMKRAV